MNVLLSIHMWTLHVNTFSRFYGFIKSETNIDRRIVIYRVFKKNSQHLKHHNMIHKVANSDTFQKTIDCMSHAVEHKGIFSCCSSLS